MRAPNRFILTLNGGSSSIKLALFEADAQLKRVLHRGIDRRGTKDSQLVITGEWAECPGSIHEGGELGYSLSHSFGAAFEQPFYTGNTGHFRLSRANHSNIHVRGYKEEGTITTPFDMTVLNDLDRFHLAIDVIDRVSGTGLIDLNGEDLPEVRNWRWS